MKQTADNTHKPGYDRAKRSDMVQTRRTKPQKYLYTYIFFKATLKKAFPQQPRGQRTNSKHKTTTKKKKQTNKQLTALNTLLEGVSQLADRNKRNRSCTERVQATCCCHGNRIPLRWWGDQPGESESRGQTRQTSHRLFYFPGKLIQINSNKKKHRGRAAAALTLSSPEVGFTFAVTMTTQQSAHAVSQTHCNREVFTAVSLRNNCQISCASHSALLQCSR